MSISNLLSTTTFSADVLSSKFSREAVKGRFRRASLFQIYFNSALDGCSHEELNSSIERFDAKNSESVHEISGKMRLHFAHGQFSTSVK